MTSITFVESQEADESTFRVEPRKSPESRKKTTDNKPLQKQKSVHTQNEKKPSVVLDQEAEQSAAPLKKKPAASQKKPSENIAPEKSTQNLLEDPEEEKSLDVKKATHKTRLKVVTNAQKFGYRTKLKKRSGLLREHDTYLESETDDQNSDHVQELTARPSEENSPEEAKKGWWKRLLDK